MRKLIVFCGLLLLIACGSGESDDDSSTTGGSDDSTTDTTGGTTVDELNGNAIDAAAMLTAINEVRASGTTCDGVDYPPVPTLIWDAQLEESALRHSNDMHDHDHFSHVGTDGSAFHERIRDTGYSLQSGSENIALGHTSTAAVMNAWLNSPGHCRNIMSSAVTEVGAARVGNYWTQNFGKPQSANN